MSADFYTHRFLRMAHFYPGTTLAMTPAMKADLFDKLEEARELLRFDFRLSPIADDHDISRRLRKESSARKEAA